MSERHNYKILIVFYMFIYLKSWLVVQNSKNALIKIRSYYMDILIKAIFIFRKFPFYFVSVFCNNLQCILTHIYIGNFQYISEIYNI